jgi:uncharacterized protein YidB (DUF937 family)
MDLLKMGQELLGDKLGDSAGGVMEALSGLTSGNGLDIGGIAEKLKAGGLGDQLGSWLGDGENAEVSGDQIKSALGEDKVAEMATKMGVDTDTAANTLKDALPSLMDKASSGGSLLDKFGGLSGALDMAKGLLK